MTGPEPTGSPPAEVVVESVPAAMSLAPNAVGPNLGAELLLDAEARPGVESMRAGLLQAGPLAVAGVLANGASVVLTVALARLLSPHSYGVLNQLTGLYLILSMPGSAVVVAVVRRVTMWHEDGSGHLVRRWAGRVHRQGTMLVLAWAVLVFFSRHAVAVLLNQQSGIGIAAILTAAAFFVLLSLDRGLLQAHRAYRPLAANLVVEISVRLVAVLVLVLAGFGPSGAAVGVLVGEVVTAGHARYAAVREWSGGRGPHLLTAAGWVAAVRPDPVLGRGTSVRRTVALDLAVASISLSMVAVLQNIDVLVVGRDNPAHSGAYAAVSVSSKAIVFGAVVLGGYLLPEAAIRWREGGHALRQLAVVLVLLAVPSVLLLGIALLAPEALLQVVFHHVYTAAADALAPLVLAMIMLSVSVVLTMYLLAVGRRWVAVVLVAGAAVLTTAALEVHGAPRATALVDLATQAAVLIVILIGFAAVHRVRVGAAGTANVTPMGEDVGPVVAAPSDRHGHDVRPASEVLASIAAEAGLRRIHFVAWRDLDDPEAGGSELHAHRIASLWAAAGLDITFRTSAVPGAPEALTRDGYRVLRRAGRYAVFPGAAWEGIRMGHRPGDALVEIWNGMPFFSPLWYRGPRLVFLHHVHAEMWGMVLPTTLARLGNTMERRIAPRFYRSSRIVTLSESSRTEIVEMLGLDADRVTVAPPGVDTRYTPGGQRSPTPLVVAVGRLVPVKRFDALLRALAEVKRDQPELRAVVIGEGYDRPALEALRDELGAAEWVSMPGRVEDSELVSWYRRAWVVASSSQREGWGMSITEAAACGTPAVATAIAGHADAVLNGESGLLVDDIGQLSGALRRVLGDDVLRSRLSKGALTRARWFTWDATARRALEALAEEATRS